MRKKAFSLALSTLFGMSIAMAGSQSQDQSAPPQNGQPAVRPQGDPQHHVQMLTKQLNLTADQQKRLLPIIIDRQERINTILHDNSLSKEDRIAKIGSVRDDSDTKIKAVLTDEQKQTYDRIQQELNERSHGHRGPQNRRPGDGNTNQ
jgi:periplasmic protein CpxP/Spy